MIKSFQFSVFSFEKKLILLVTGYWLLVTILCGCQNQQLYKDSQVLMGTFVEVTSPDKRAAKIAFAEIKRIEGMLSRYKQDSDIGRLNKSGKATVNPETIYVIKKAKDFWYNTDGAFDITVAPLLDLWGFTDKNYRLPEKNEIDEKLKLIGTDKIIIDEINNTLEFQKVGMAVDLGAIAKGYVVDCAVKKLKGLGIKSCLIGAGGDIYCLGTKFGSPWKVAVRSPRGEGLVDFLELKDKAVATSGDYERYFIKDNKRYAHIFNPKTGYPSDSGVISVTVIADDCLTADALATSVFLLGKAKGEQLARKFKAEVISVITE